MRKITTFAVDLFEILCTNFKKIQKEKVQKKSIWATIFGSINRVFLEHLSLWKIVNFKFRNRFQIWNLDQLNSFRNIFFN